MPKIEAATVAEHHRMRRGALLAAGLELLTTGGPQALTPQAVGKAAGIARSSVYQYFPSTDELVAAVLDFAFDIAHAHVSQDLDDAGTPAERVTRLVEHGLANATDDTHRGFGQLDPGALTSDQRARLEALHRGALAPLEAALADLGADSPAFAATMVDAMTQAAARQIIAGADHDETRAALLDAVFRGPARADS